MDAIESIVVVEDDATLRGVLLMALRNAGFGRVKAAARGDDGLALVRAERPSLVVLDLMLPGLGGLAVCRRIRETPALAGTRVVMLTAKAEDRDVVLGLETGADDYVTKPFALDVLVARIRAVLRRDDPVAPGRSLDGLSFDGTGSLASLGGAPLSLTRTESRILALFASHPGRVYTRQQIIEATQGEEKAVTDRTVDVQIVNLRRKLGDWARHIETIRGVGYRVKP